MRAGPYTGTVIPNVLALGFIAGLFGRRGLWFVLAAALVWPVVLTATGVGTGLGLWIGGAAFAALNAAVGVLAGNGVRWLVRRALLSKMPDAS
jgi:hypothetical protein